MSGDSGITIGPPMETAPANPLLLTLATEAAACGAFGAIKSTANTLSLAARSGANANYAVSAQAATLRLRLETPDRWLSESVEGALLEGNDSLEELLAEELDALGAAAPPFKFRHFRDDARVYVFELELPLPASEAAATALTYLRAFAATFDQLGDMGEAPEAK